MIENKIETEEKKRRKNLPVLLPVAVILVILVTVLYNTLIRGPRYYSGYEIEKKTERGTVMDTVFFEADGKLISYNKEGVSAFGIDGKILWNAGFNFKIPKVVTANEFVAAADIGDNMLSFMNQKSTPVSVVNIQMPGNICDIAVSEEGQVAVLMEAPKGNLIRILEPFNKNNQLKAEIKTFREEDGLGLTLGISKDGTKLVTEFIKPEEADLVGTLTFYNFGVTGEGTNADRIVGIYPYRNTVFGKIEFLTNSYVCAFGDNRLVGFSMRHEPNLVFEKGIHGKILHAKGDESGIALVILENRTKTQGLTNRKGEENLVFVDEEASGKSGEFLLRISTKGETAFERELSFQKSGLHYKDGEAVVHGGESCVIYNSDGSEKFKATFNESLLHIYPSQKNDRYFMVTGGHILTIKLNE